MMHDPFPYLIKTRFTMTSDLVWKYINEIKLNLNEYHGYSKFDEQGTWSSMWTFKSKYDLDRILLLLGTVGLVPSVMYEICITK